MRTLFFTAILCSLVLALPILCGCDGSTEPPDLPGTWVDTTDGNEFLTFNADGTWSWVDELRGSTGLRAESSGTWSQSDGVITVSGTNLNGEVFTASCEFLDNGNLYCPRFVEAAGDDDHPEEYEKI